MSLWHISMPFLIIFGIIAIFLYLKNIYKTVIALRREEYTIRTGLRIVGIFLPFVGVFMGLVSGK